MTAFAIRRMLRSASVEKELSLIAVRTPFVVGMLVLIAACTTEPPTSTSSSSLPVAVTGETSTASATGGATGSNGSAPAPKSHQIGLSLLRGPIGTSVRISGRFCSGTPSQHRAYLSGIVYREGKTVGGLNVGLVRAKRFSVPYTIPERAMDIQGLGGGWILLGDTIRFVAGPADICATRQFTVQGFRACIGGWYLVACDRRHDYLAGDHPEVRAEVVPAYAGLVARVWRRPPHEEWQPVASVSVNDQGHLLYHWNTTNSDVRNAPWRFRFVMPGQGQSNIVQLEVLPVDD